MGNCASSALENIEDDGNVVYVIDEDEQRVGNSHGSRKIASIYSRRGKKGPNQDAIILCQGFGTEDGIFCGVFDGHGKNGHIVSKFARDSLPFMLLRQHNAFLIDEDDLDFTDNSPMASSTDSAEDSPPSLPPMFLEWERVCVSAFKSMDREIKAQMGMDCNFSGTTAVSIIKQGRDLIIANLGDSRAILATKNRNGSVVALQLTTDMKPCLPNEAERIRKFNGRVFGLKDEPRTQRVWLPDEDYPGLAMSRSFGDFQLKHYGVISTPEVTYHSITNGDLFIVLATDGVWDVLSNEKVVSIVMCAKSKQEAPKAVVEAAVRQWMTVFSTSRVDDCSAACLFLHDVM